MINIAVKIKKTKISDLVLTKNEGRDIRSDAFHGLLASIEKLGYLSLVIANKRNMNVVSGHQRIYALQQMNVESVPVVFVDLDEAEELMLRVTMNNQAIEGFWTYKLNEILEEIRNDDEGFFITARLEELKRSSGVNEKLIDENIKENEITENIGVTHRCGDCGYEW